jgi:lipopolysaccharide heptosyltransferase II
MPPRILIVRFSSIGDLLLATPLLRALRARHPDAQITFVTREDMADTLRHNPRISELIAWPRAGSVTDLAHQLRRQRWTHRLDLHGSLRSMALRALMGGRWTGYSKDRLQRELLIVSRRRVGRAIPHVADRYFAAARDLDVVPDGGPPEFFVTDAARDAADAVLEGHRLAANRPLIALAPGAAHFTKRWPLRHWVALAERLSADYDLVVVGGPTDRATAAAIAAAAPERCMSVAGDLSLDGTAALLERAECVVVGDTGVLHLATAVGTAVVGLYGPTVEEFGFFPYHASYVALQHDLTCRPCSSRGGPVCPLGHHHCLEWLEVDEVLAAIRTGAEIKATREAAS